MHVIVVTFDVVRDMVEEVQREQILHALFHLRNTENLTFPHWEFPKDDHVVGTGVSAYGDAADNPLINPDLQCTVGVHDQRIDMRKRIAALPVILEDVFRYFAYCIPGEGLSDPPGLYSGHVGLAQQCALHDFNGSDPCGMLENNFCSFV